MSDNNELIPENEKTTFVSNSIDNVKSCHAWRASLIVLAGWELGREVWLEGDESIFGRSESLGNTCIPRPSVSREHARISRIYNAAENCDEFQVIDLKSRNGSFVNGVPITASRLSNGDKLQLGEVLFKFILQDEADVRFHQDVHRLIHYNQLTGLLTLDAFREHLEAEMFCSGTISPFCLAMTDLDGLKRVNDTYGHLAGQMVVREMGVLLRANIRPADKAGLYGGDEAILMFPNTRLAEAQDILEGIRRAVEQSTFELNGDTFAVTISQGVAEWPMHGKSPEALIASADHALYEAKAAGRNCVRVAQLSISEIETTEEDEGGAS
jgi:diguanylate cyclase (GGDEF)-like protein